MPRNKPYDASCWIPTPPQHSGKTYTGADDRERQTVVRRPSLCFLAELPAFLFAKLLGDVVIDALTSCRGELLGTGDDAVPLLLGEPALDILTRDTIFHHTIDESGIEVVAGAHRADRRCLDGRLALAKTAVGAKLHRAGSLSIDELLAVERDL